jgi:hypothetical protein
MSGHVTKRQCPMTGLGAVRAQRMFMAIVRLDWPWALRRALAVELTR